MKYCQECPSPHQCAEEGECIGPAKFKSRQPKSANWQDCPLCTFHTEHGETHLKEFCILHQRINDLLEESGYVAYGRQADERLIESLLVAAKAARSAIDSLMGDSDLPDDNSDEMKAMELLDAAISDAEPDEQ